MRVDDDLSHVTSRDFRFLRDEEIVRLLVLHRTQSDHARAKQAWDQLVENVFDRIRTRVAVWRWTGEGVQVAPHDVDDVTQLAIIRLAGIMEGFKGTLLPQFRAYALTCADFTCMDHARKEMNRDKRVAGSIQEELAGDQEGIGRFDAELGRLAEQAASREFEQREAAEMIAGGLPLIPSEDQRAVVQMTLDGVPVEEIAERLGTSVDNVYQLRRRGLIKLKEVLGDGLG